MEDYMLSVDELRERLFDRTVLVVSEVTHINRVTIAKIKRGEAKKIHKLVQQRLSEYFREHP